WFFLHESELGPEDYFVRFKSFEDGDLGPLQQANFELRLVGIGDARALDLGAEGKVAFRLQIGCHNLAQALRRRQCVIKRNEDEANQGERENSVHVELCSGQGSKTQ